MHFKLLIFTSIFFVFYESKAQSDEIVNPSNKWFFGVEIGLNTITSIAPKHEKSFQGGLLVEYYFAKHWSAQELNTLKQGLVIEIKWLQLAFLMVRLFRYP